MTFTPAQPVITFTDLTSASRASTSAVTTLSALFRVHPADATCTFRRIWDTTSTPAAMYLNDNSGPDRSLRALVVGIGEVIVDVRCVASGLDVTERVVFTALSPDACELPITLGAAAVSGTWTSSCTSTQRGGNQTPYNELAAHVLAIPIRELQKDNPSLMDLSRWDSLFQRSDNIGLFSRGTQADEVRAHWSPGVGPWQLERRLRTWVACTAQKRFGEDPSRNHCIPIAEAIYDEDSDSLRVSRVAGSDVDGGVQSRWCRWGAADEEFRCYWYDIANAEGNATRYSRDGRLKKRCRTKECTNPEFWYDITPLPFGFVSFTDTDGKKYVAFPANDIGEAGTGTGYTATFVRGVPADKHARELERDDGYGWFVDWEGTEVLYIEQCSTPGSCRWHRV